MTAQLTKVTQVVLFEEGDILEAELYCLLCVVAVAFGCVFAYP